MSATDRATDPLALIPPSEWDRLYDALAQCALSAYRSGSVAVELAPAPNITAERRRAPLPVLERAA